MRSQLSSRQTRIFLTVFLAALLAVAVITGWIIVRAQNDPEAVQRIEYYEALRDSAQAVQDSLANAERGL